LDSTTESVATSLVLKRSLFVAGTLTDDEGEPLGRVRILAYVVRKSGFAELSLDRLRARTLGPVTAAWSKREDYAHSTVIFSTTTDSRGRFVVEVTRTGDLWLVSRVAGHSPVRSAIGYVGCDMQGIRLSAKPTTAGRVRVLVGGTPVVSRDLRVADVSRLDVQPTFRARTDMHGTVSTEWLEPGRRYAFIVRGTASRMVIGIARWESQREIDLADLPSNLSNVR
jgi:hypothetical protein